MLLSQAREGTLAIEEMDGGTFTISNGGVFGSLYGTPIINPPQSAILGMHATNDRPVAIYGKVRQQTCKHYILLVASMLLTFCNVNLLADIFILCFLFVRKNWWASTADVIDVVLILSGFRCACTCT